VSAGEVTLGDFPEFPQGPLPDSVAVELQGLLDAAVDEGVIRGASAAVIVAEAGSWAGAAGVNPIEGGAPMTAASVLPTHSVGKTVIAAQTLRLVEEEKLGLDDLAADHIPPQFPSFSPSDLHDITIRELLGMRSGLIDGGSPSADPGPKPVYANVNYDLLAAIINHVTGRRLPELVHDDVLSGPGLDGLVIDAPEYVRWPHDGHMWADAATWPGGDTSYMGASCCPRRRSERCSISTVSSTAWEPSTSRTRMLLAATARHPSDTEVQEAARSSDSSPFPTKASSSTCGPHRASVVMGSPSSGPSWKLSETPLRDE
jgi:CubicO group peptidase (beta-lactamase class C family)